LEDRHPAGLAAVQRRVAPKQKLESEKEPKQLSEPILFS
jgi:hypothetical protein